MIDMITSNISDLSAVPLPDEFTVDPHDEAAVMRILGVDQGNDGANVSTFQSSL